MHLKVVQLALSKKKKNKTKQIAWFFYFTRPYNCLTSFGFSFLYSPDFNLPKVRKPILSLFNFKTLNDTLSNNLFTSWFLPSQITISTIEVLVFLSNSLNLTLFGIHLVPSSTIPFLSLLISLSNLSYLSLLNFLM